MPSYNALTVILERDISDEQLEMMTTAISMLRGVLRVVPGEVTSADVIAEMRAKHELRRKLSEALNDYA